MIKLNNKEITKDELENLLKRRALSTGLIRFFYNQFKVKLTVIEEEFDIDIHPFCIKMGKGNLFPFMRNSLIQSCKFFCKGKA